MESTASRTIFKRLHSVLVQRGQSEIHRRWNFSISITGKSSAVIATHCESDVGYKTCKWMFSKYVEYLSIRFSVYERARWRNMCIAKYKIKCTYIIAVIVCLYLPAT